jgi:hypothetical protein
MYLIAAVLSIPHFLTRNMFKFVVHHNNLTTVEAYIGSIEHPHQRYMLMEIHRLLMTFSGVKTKIRYRLLFYDGIKWICYLKPIKGKEIEICFLNGFKLTERSYLQAANRKIVKGITINEITDSKLEMIAEVFTEALLIDQANKHQ